ncbi:flagellar hook-associated protein FlgK [Hydrocarboniclastica marina]|uniref:Flagellar hook-associated protein 1 n=1 Tax=Hydrocarboniclastica marina TaxID=2259620 RepID=A0A4P7XHX8_9ALTE|nr:flagellar hook-associated protein FlgK [Hydrocarboniclastica marina]QCF25862.1 flagellar hook-associated protein FlgK [Hydrocarboniclastica marina]
MAGLINIGLTGLLSHQSALSTTGNNVTNANTPGYSRQQAMFETLPSQYAGSGYIGNGVTIANVQRLNSEFVNQQLRNDTTLNGEQGALASEMGRLDNLFGSSSTGLNGALSEFFAAVHDSAESPDSLPQRQLLISRAESLAQRFHSISNKLEEQAASVEQQLTADIARVNGLAKEVADLNLAITSAPGLSRGIQPNELIDQRDEKLRQLAESVPIQTSPADGGQINVYFGNGQTLVQGGSSNSLSVVPQAAGHSQIQLDNGVSTKNVTGVMTGGRVGALVAFREGGLDAAQGRLDAIADGLIGEFNTQHQAGFDLNGNPGAALFSGTGASGIEVAISDPEAVALAGSAGGNSLDNENALALSEIAGRDIPGLGNITLNEAYGLLVTEVGNETSRAQRGLEASSALLEQSSNSWQEQSGVNLDEEAGKLIQYQAAYNASAQVVSVARDLFNTLLNSFR